MEPTIEGWSLTRNRNGRPGPWIWQYLDDEPCGSPEAQLEECPARKGDGLIGLNCNGERYSVI